jgi:aspartate 1-decarboxylase
MANFKSAILMTGSATTASGQDVELIAPIDVKNEDRISFQFYNPNASATSGTLGAAAEWTQIGDDVVVSGSSSALKSISTTGLMWVGATISGTTTFGAGHTYALLRQA